MASLAASTFARRAAARGFHSTAASQYKVCVVGGAGGIGQPLSMLLKMNPDVSHVSVFDMVGAPGVAADLSHIDTPASVSGHGMNLEQFKGDDIEDKDAYQAAEFDKALAGCDVVVRDTFGRGGLPGRAASLGAHSFCSAGLVREPLSGRRPPGLLALLSARK